MSYPDDEPKAADVTAPVLRQGAVTLRPLTDHDLERLLDVIAGPGVAEWWGPPEDADGEREGLRRDGSAFAIDVDGALAGWLGFHEENDPGYRSAGLDIVLAPGHQGRGVGPAAIRLAARWLIEVRGHHRLTIDPAVANERAIRAYEKVGFKPVGVMRRVERGADGEWRDNLLMDLLAEELS